MRPNAIDVLVVGAGPYGLSVAAHLAGANVNYRVVGTPMHTWREHMPQGMLLRSEGFASNLSDPTDQLTLERYCTEHALDVGGWARPVPLEVYCDYGQWFREQADLPVEDVQVVHIEPADGGFDVELASGETVHTAAVVLAVGLTHYGYVPEALADIPPQLASHSSSVRGGISGAAIAHLQPGAFAGRDVAVIGAGQSALECAALLHEHGAEVSLLARGDHINWNRPPDPVARPLLERMRVGPHGGVCTGWDCWAVEHAPLLFKRLPERKRLQLAATFAGPSGAWWLRDRIEGKVKLRFSRSLQRARVSGDGVELDVAAPGGIETIRADHVISATGYRVDLDRLAFLDAGTRAALRVSGSCPQLSRTFESSVPGLYFVGASSLTTFGPVVRFVVGARFTARTLARQLANRAPRPMPSRPAA